MSICIVVQRYGEEVVGGAEYHARKLAEKLVSSGVAVQVLTTTARCAKTWKDAFPEGRSVVNGVTVHRSLVKRQRSRLLFPILHRILKVLHFFPWLKTSKLLHRFILKLEEAWYRLQGPYSPQILEAIQSRKSSVSTFVFFSYLYYPTVYGLPLVQKKAVLVPTLHDEPSLYFLHTKKILEQSRFVFFNHELEKELSALILAPTGQSRVVGMAVEKWANPLKVSKFDSLLSKPYLLYLGRISPAKQIDELLEGFECLKRKLPQYSLVLGGEIEAGYHPNMPEGVLYLGRIDEEEKDYLLHNCCAVISFSKYESLSLVLLEALAYGKYFIGSKQCAIFRSFSETDELVKVFNSSAELIDLLAEFAYFFSNGKSVAPKQHPIYNWPCVLESYHYAMNQIEVARKS